MRELVHIRVERVARVTPTSQKKWWGSKPTKFSEGAFVTTKARARGLINGEVQLAFAHQRVAWKATNLIRMVGPI